MDTADVTPASRTEEEDETGSSRAGEAARRPEWPPLVTRLPLTPTPLPLLPLWTATALPRLLETTTTTEMRDQPPTAMAPLPQLMTAMALLLPLMTAMALPQLMTAMALPLEITMTTPMTPL